MLAWMTRWKVIYTKHISFDHFTPSALLHLGDESTTIDIQIHTSPLTFPLATGASDRAL